ncbi:ATP-dependent DNA helicase [Duganella sp. Leaf126]|uniref:DEAD/DEAH box helicase n=1 Tax=Duganella sp. Leaf126 TaxID=1736266 RepID=UPI0006F7A2B0|nr:DEAD/DEAH box helicase [Duganella sp. Leaf126]KQQ36238.1 ATP-dependent DNA helicase [Duganella sp. Leaf126]
MIQADPPERHAFHPAVAAWFDATFAAATEAQRRAWPLIHAGSPTLIAAPTGSGKTLTAFLAAIDALVRESAAGPLPDATRVLYVSPLKALSNDIRVNLQAPLDGIGARLQAMGLPPHGIRSAVRTGDTPQAERSAMRRRAPHILVSTPESLYVLLGSDSGRAMLAGVRTVIVDEIHAVAGSKRGSHLALSLERLDALCAAPPVRVGLSATQKPLSTVAHFLAGTGRQCAVVDVGHVRARDLGLELPPAPLEAVMSNDVWERVYDRLAELTVLHRTTLVFVNTRRMAERMARHLADRLGGEHVAAHHGSLSKEYRLDAEQRLKHGALRVLVATASLELGIDIGDVDLVCQIGSPRSIAAFLQRVGRSGHHVGGLPKGRLFPTSRDDLVECAALLDCVRRDELDVLHVPVAPLDVLAQHIVAEVASREWHEDLLFDLVRKAWPYADLARERYDAVLRMLATGYATRQGMRGAYLHRDTVSGTVRGRRGGRLTAVTSGGTIPDNADYTVLLEPQGLAIGTVHEDFAVESLAGDVFQLGNTSYRIQRIDAGKVRVEDAHGAAPNIPFWMGEAPGRSDELSFGVARLRGEIDRLLAGDAEPPGAPARKGTRKSAKAPTTAALTPATATVAITAAKATAAVKETAVAAPAAVKATATAAATAAREAGETAETAEAAEAAEAARQRAMDWLHDQLGLHDAAARQLVDYLARARAALGALPTHDTLVMERFFDESGGMQLVLHAPYGSRINRAWGLALRKRFCRNFNFELQAAATEDAIVLSLSESHSFALDEVWRYLRSATAEQVLVQALLDAPLFNVRWRWNATTALALPRYAGGRKVAPQLQRMKSDDLLAAVFPDQAACLENIVGERELPSHPLVDQTLDDCLHEAMDSDGWLALLRRMEAGEVRLLARDLAAPSPLAMEILNARPYAFLDDAPLEERRTQAVLNRRWTDPASTDDLGALDAGAIEAVAREAWPDVRNSDEMHEALVALAAVTDAEARAHAGWPEWLQALAASGRATLLADGDTMLWVALERLACLRAAFPAASATPALTPPGYADDEAWTDDGALVELLRARLSGFGPQAVAAIATPLGLDPAAVGIALVRLETEGYVMRGRFTPGVDHEQWVERHLLARIHRYTINRLRREIEPVERQDFMRFLLDWQHVSAGTRLTGQDGLAQSLAQLEGYEAAAGGWESDVLAQRVDDYEAAWLDDLCRTGKVVWARIGAPAGAGRAQGDAQLRGPARGPVRGTPLVLLPRRQLPLWHALPPAAGDITVSSRAARVLAALRSEGAMFFDELAREARLLGAELETALGELVATGLVNADSYAGLRAMLAPASKRNTLDRRRRRGLVGAGPAMEEAGRWALVRRALGHAGGVNVIELPSEIVAAAVAGQQNPASAARKPAPAQRARTDPAALEHVAMTLLRRYGVMCWRLLEREAAWMPAWRDLLPVYHRLEARGDIRGGRFVAGLSGEQFALPEAIPLLRETRRRPPDGQLVCISGIDPLNLCGTVLPGDKVPALAGNRIVLRDGLPVAAQVGNRLRYVGTPEPVERELLRAHLLAHA